jgi:hypothetical protein
VWVLAIQFPLAGSLGANCCFVFWLLFGFFGWELCLEAVSSMLLGSAWEIFGLPSSQVGLMFDLFGISCRVVDGL